MGGHLYLHHRGRSSAPTSSGCCVSGLLVQRLLANLHLTHRYSRQGGSDADTPRPALHIAVESADVRVKSEPENGAVNLGKRARSPSPTAVSRSAQANAASGASRVASYATAPHSPGSNPALRRQTGPRKSQGRSHRRAHNTNGRRSASPPRPRSDGTRPAKRAEDMYVCCLAVYRV